MHKIAFFISEHGFGHSSRSSALINQLLTNPKIEISIFSDIPKWFFDKSILGEFEYNNIKSDIGLVQDNPFTENLEKSIANLKAFYPFQEKYIQLISEKLQSFKTDLVICDIAPIGIEVARLLEIRSVLIENFTWDWIYETYVKEYPEMKFFIEYIKNIYSMADFHFQTKPLCSRNNQFPLFSPVFRNHRKSKNEMRNILEIPVSAKMVLISMGGVPLSIKNLQINTKDRNLYFVIPGSEVENQFVKDRIMFLPNNHSYFHPDLVHASDMVIGKVGYSTIAEVYSAQIPFLYIPRKKFRESTFLEKFIKSEMNGKSINQEFLYDGSIIEKIESLFEVPIAKKNPKNGAIEMAQFIIEKVLS